MSSSSGRKRRDGQRLSRDRKSQTSREIMARQTWGIKTALWEAPSVPLYTYLLIPTYFLFLLGSRQQLSIAAAADGFGPHIHIGMGRGWGTVHGLDAAVRSVDRLCSAGRGPVGAYGPGWCGRGDGLAARTNSQDSTAC